MLGEHYKIPATQLNQVAARWCTPLAQNKDEERSGNGAGKKIGIEELGMKLDRIAERLETLEALITANPDYAGLIPYIRLTQASVGLYNEPLKLLSRIRLAERQQGRLKSRDEMSRCIIQSLALKGPLSTSALAREVKGMRGKSSRRIIRERLIKLEGAGIIRRLKGTAATYELVE